MKYPLVTVVMPVYNAEEYVADAIESILTQTFNDLEFLIINDGSTDKSLDIIQKYAKKNPQIILINQPNKGLVASLNLGIKRARGKLIARQDADDKSDPKRIKRQVDFLAAHPEVVIVGSSIDVVDEEGRFMHKHAVLLNDLELKQELLVRSPFAHGSVMMRKEMVIKAGLYTQDSWPVEDYELWLRLSRYGQLANIDECLYTYREHTQNISRKNAKLQLQKLSVVRQRAWKERERLLPKKPINLTFYKKLETGQLRIERIIDNTVFISKAAWRHGQKTLALKTMMTLAGRPTVYKKAAGKLRRGVRK